ncbi:dihydrofolate reductase family protein [Lactiplantibacillus paraplantarum]|uniref:dihydrofolate reductase family protein n=1 Tax=Lactiplantibacillus paraplantarum TaxID=60520 RepID=UPI000512F96C|nr:dihydrofolate reductase family protein [Lactiplantibacillus paraplantarum]OAX74089.1 deaminase [Lactiplantibacillus plantarum]ALO03825.1 deaminase [Lactiplantibacillus paraplantarum]KGE76024.1 deaminase [Lactiplantibacillus paraplantarum]MCT4457748.1 deaminase [Lactiplantibacillus paraplantarum]RDG11262.1 deaminase [Lactiplantibacillus paraplantarum]
MKRAKVIIHMHTSIDGKIDGAYGKQAGDQFSGDFYSKQLFQLSSANANGATTVAMYAATGHLDLTPFKGQTPLYENWLPKIEAATWDIAFDRRGTMAWDKNYFDYGGKKSRVIEVLTKQASQAYLAFLQSMEIPYIIGGDQELDLGLVLEVLRASYGIKAISLAGGAKINGAFLKAGLVDELSIVVSPYISGDNSVQGIFNTSGQFVDQKFEIMTTEKLQDGGVYLRYLATK